PYLIGATPPPPLPPLRKGGTEGGWEIYEAGCKNGLVLRGTATCPVAVSMDRGRTWQDCGSFHDNLDLTDRVKAQQQYWLRFGTGARQLAGTGLTMVTVCQANATVLPRLTGGGSKVHFETSGKAVVASGSS